jgi:methionyl-tRNA synthetase
MKTYYLTTPLYYVNAAPHIGHAYTTLAADILARHKRMTGAKVHLLTGTDEHGSKIEAVAREAGKSPKAYADEVAAQFADLWKHLDIRHDDFIRTTEERHESRVQAVFKHLLEKGDIYKGTYKGFYCVSDETYWTETEAPPDEKGRRLCPNADCRRPLQVAEEESYFFKLSRYQEPLLQHYRGHPEFLQPSQRGHEIVRFVEEGLHDLAVSRTKVAWGVPLPFDTKHVVYVWFDALLNYITATGYVPPGMPPRGADRSAELWPADVHLVGKEIYRFHAVTWPAMLMALGVPLPKSVFAHGWWTVEGQKMSKSKGNFVDPREITREFGVDTFRYFLFREMPFGNDGDFSRETLRKRYNSELANDLGNLISRTTNMVDKYLAGALPGRPDLGRSPVTKELMELRPRIDEAMDRLAFQEALNQVWSGVRRLNETIDKEKPWETAKTDMDRVRRVLHDVACSLRMVGGWIAPFMPQTSAKMQAMLGVRAFGETPEGGGRIMKGAPLFPRK